MEYRSVTDGRTDGRTVRIAISLSRVSMLVLVLGDDELHQSQSAVDAHIFPMLVQTPDGFCHFLNMLTDVASTTSWGSLFQELMTLELKKHCLTAVQHLCLHSLCLQTVENVYNLIPENPIYLLCKYIGHVTMSQPRFRMDCVVWFLRLKCIKVSWKHVSDVTVLINIAVV